MGQEHFKAVEGLRGYLALWVAIGHGLQLSGLFNLGGVASILLQTDVPVKVFMILSGFVITNLLIQKEEPYRGYIVRRAFRLYPIYIVGCTLGYLVMPLWRDIALNPTMNGINGWPDYAGNVLAIVDQTLNNTLPHLLAHLFMLHGAIPTSILPQSAMTFLPAAWSISLEWQFYLLAPLLILNGRPVVRAVTLTLLIVGYVLFSKGALGQYSDMSMILEASAYFAIGIASRLMYPLIKSDRANLYYVFLMIVLIGLFYLRRELSLIVWALVFSFICISERQSKLARVYEFFLEGRLPLLVGGASYSVYLLHRPIQVFLGYGALQVLGGGQYVVLLSQILAIVVVIPLAIVSHDYVEKPGIRLGKLVANRVSGSRVEA